MSRKAISTTRLEGMSPVGIGGRTAYDAWEQLRLVLQRELDPGAAHFLAEPVVHDQEVTWFATGEGDVTSLFDLGEEDRQALIAKTEARVAEIHKTASRLRENAATPTDRQMANMLQAALTTPPPSEARPVIYSVAGEPVLALWGTQDTARTGTAMPLQEFFRTERAAPSGGGTGGCPPLPPEDGGDVRAVPVFVAAAPFPWWLLWLLFALIALFIFFKLIGACSLFGIRTPFLGYCPGEVAIEDSEYDRLREEERALRQTILSLRENVYDAPYCERLVEVPGEEADEIDRRLRDAEAEDGDIQITITWDSYDDLDLHVTCPAGEGRIGHDSPAACGGRLDVDQNAGRRRRGDPVENIVFDETQMVHGEYVIRVHNYRSETGEPMPFRIRLRRNGEDEYYEGQVGPEQWVDVTRFIVE